MGYTSQDAKTYVPNGVWDLPEAQAQIIMSFQLRQVGGINRQEFTPSGLLMRETSAIRPAAHRRTVEWHARMRLQAHSEARARMGDTFWLKYPTLEASAIVAGLQLPSRVIGG